MGDVCWHKDFKKELMDRTGRLRIMKRTLQPGTVKPTFTVARGEMLTMMEAVVDDLRGKWCDVYKPAMYNYIRKSFQMCGFGMPVPGQEELNVSLFNTHIANTKSSPMYNALSARPSVAANRQPVVIEYDATSSSSDGEVDATIEWEQ
eukprot:GHVU01082026.1.p6 GENE.GHVU01082026.1~~GHVU01082026.1.p6  ORF type:complete len:148 (-),score=19.68 GHVU01082026.1:564-1007(-)